MQNTLPVWFETTSLGALALVLLVDLVISYRRPHVPSTRESALWVGFYSALAIVFGLTIAAFSNQETASEFFAGWLTEYSLSADNLFVFVLIMARFAVAKKQQQRVLMVGVLLSLVLRGLFILAGAALLHAFSAIFYLFGAFLIYTAYHQAFRTEDDEEETETRLVRWLRSNLKLKPVVLVFLAIAVTDVMFAFDSIPAIFGITTNVFLVFSANLFALMGLRQLYFLLSGLLEKLEYLKFGIAFILAFIGLKLVSHAMAVNSLPFINGGMPIEWAPEIPTWVSLLVILFAIATAAALSAIKLRQARQK
jgi:tellurite resistance protein TerC